MICEEPPHLVWWEKSLLTASVHEPRCGQWRSQFPSSIPGTEMHHFLNSLRKVVGAKPLQPPNRKDQQPTALLSRTGTCVCTTVHKLLPVDSLMSVTIQCPEGLNE